MGIVSDEEIQRCLEGTINDPEIGPIEGTIQEHANLIARGVRPLALLGHVQPDPWNLLRAYNRLSYLGGAGQKYGAGDRAPIPIVALRKDGSCADAGFAAKPWVAETFKWIGDNIPQPHLNRIIGLMLGYSVDAIAALEESESGKMFPDMIIESPAPESTLRRWSTATTQPYTTTCQGNMNP